MRYLVIFSLLLPSFAQAAIVSYFKYEDGRTNWQYVANFSSSILIILLSLVILGLFIARRRLFKAHRELHAIRDDLEVRVKERTATLNESNTKLLASNEALEQEIAQHILTTKRLMTSEAYITDILTSMPLMLVCLDKDGRITHWNRRTEEVSGISAERALGKSLWEAYPTATVSPDQIQQAIKNQDTVHIKQSLRSMSHFDITIYPLRENSDGGVVLLIDDISKETMAENMLIHNDKMSFMGEMASTMAHDINTPLQGILLDLRSFQRALRANADSDDAQQNAKRAERLDEIANQMSLKGDQVNTIINNLLAFARSRQEKKQMVNMVDVMENTLRLAGDILSVSERLPFHRIKIERHFDENLPLTPCYITEMQQVFLSLLRNACHSLDEKLASEVVTTDSDKPFIPTIKLLLAECYGNLWIKVQHNGKGLSNEEQMYLFEPFFSNQEPEKSVDAGQRLSFSYYIITEQHQGHMAVTSDEESGSTFHMQPPLQD